MQLGSPIDALASALYSAAHNDLPPFQYRQWTPGLKKQGITADEAPLVERRPAVHECQVFAMFPQAWSSTALGFGGVGGQAFTPAYTVIIEGPAGDYCVYFGGRFAYLVPADANAAFREDVVNQSMVAVGQAGRYRRAAQSA